MSCEFDLCLTGSLVLVQYSVCVHASASFPGRHLGWKGLVPVWCYFPLVWRARGGLCTVDMSARPDHFEGVAPMPAAVDQKQDYNKSVTSFHQALHIVRHATDVYAVDITRLERRSQETNPDITHHHHSPRICPSRRQPWARRLLHLRRLLACPSLHHIGLLATCHGHNNLPAMSVALEHWGRVLVESGTANWRLNTSRTLFAAGNSSLACMSC